jgi:uncharacterized protein (DUF1800 family)
MQTQKVSRRNFLRMGAAMSAASAALAACSRVPGALAINERVATAEKPIPTPLAATTTSAPPESSARAWLAANRLMFGPRVGDIEHITKIGVDAFIDEQLALDASVKEPISILNERLNALDAITATSASDLYAQYDKQRGQLLQQMQNATIIRAVYAQRQLYEVMVDFWTNHFNVYFLKNNVAMLKPIEDREVIRPHALGNFRDLLMADSKSPAMLVYLDNQANQKQHPDENYARELLELHTVGVNGGYTEHDIKELSRALTGWGINGLNVANAMYEPGEFRFFAARHDDTEKNVMGLKIPARGGERDVPMVIDYLASHPKTAEFICTKLARRFISDTPPASAINKAVTAFTKSKGDIKATLGALLHSDEFKQSAGQKVKRPFEFVASALRALDADVQTSPRILQYFQQMGQPLFGWSPPNGFPDVKSAWMESSSLLARWNFALEICRNSIRTANVDLKKLMPSGAQNADALIDAVALRLLGAPLPANAKEKLKPFATTANLPTLVGLILASPLYQIRG